MRAKITVREKPVEKKSVPSKKERVSKAEKKVEKKNENPIEKADDFVPVESDDIIKTAPLKKSKTKTKPSKPAQKPAEKQEPAKRQEQNGNVIENESDSDSDISDIVSPDQEQIITVDSVPLDTKIQQKIKEKNINVEKLKKLKRVKDDTDSTPIEERGTVYLGRIPHGFYEDQMRSYFSQFGTVTRLRLSRNRKTGRSKHFAFIEFSDKPTAQVVAETMDGYLMFNHILKCHVVPDEKVHESMWVGANRPFRVVPFTKINRTQHNKPKTEEQHKKVVDRLVAKEEKLKKRLAEMGVDFEIEGGYGDLVSQQKKVKVESVSPVQAKA